jgi:hypothetical protein
MQTKKMHCCNIMDLSLENPNIGIIYLNFFRQYGIPEHEDDGTNEVVPMKLIKYCPWCSAELPENYRNKWYETLQKEYTINDPWNEDFLLPEEFHTDEWWIKRGY